MSYKANAFTLVLVLIVPCSALRRLEARPHDASNFKIGTEIRTSVPDPEYFEANFETVEFAKEPFAHQMLMDGSLNMTSSQKVWCSHYWTHLLSEATEKLRKASKTDSTSVLSAVDAIPALSQAVLFDAQTWETRFLPKVHVALELVKNASSPEEAHMKELLERLENQFLKDMSEPQVMFYLGMTDQKTFTYSKRPEKVAVPLLNTMVMHSIDQATARAKTDKRSIMVAGFFENVSSLGISRGEWVLEEVLDSHGNKDVKKALSSVTPIIAFRLTANEKGGPAYVLIEGNGRVNAMKVAFDKIRLADPTFVAPSITLNVFDFDGPEVARKNRNFFLDLNWKNQFPAVAVLGWRRQVPDSIRSVSKEFEAVVKSRPRYFGQEPESSGLYAGP